MKKVIALMALAGLITVGCAHRDRDRNAGGTYDETIMQSGSSTNDVNRQTTDDKNSNSGNRSSTTDSNPSKSSSDNGSNPNPSDKTPQR